MNNFSYIVSVDLLSGTTLYICDCGVGFRFYLDVLDLFSTGLYNNICFVITCSLCEETDGATVAEDDVADADTVSASG